jgi:hypothetical protein
LESLKKAYARKIFPFESETICGRASLPESSDFPCSAIFTVGLNVFPKSSDLAKETTPPPVQARSNLPSLFRNGVAAFAQSKPGPLQDEEGLAGALIPEWDK